MKASCAIALIALLAVQAKKPCNKPSPSCPECGSCPKNYLARMDFYHIKPVLSGLGQNWSFQEYFNIFGEGGEYIADDGVFSFDCKGGFIDSTVFTKWVPPSSLPEANRDKFFIYADAVAEIPKNGRLVVEFEGTGETFKTDQGPFPSQVIQSNDLRAANVQFCTFDNDTGVHFNWILTNDRVYVSYMIVDAFVYVLPIKQRRPCDWHNMQTVFNERNKNVIFSLDGKEMLRLTKIGYQLERQYMVVDNGTLEGPVWPLTIQYGFGTFQMIDAYPACKRSDSCCDCCFPLVREGLTNALFGFAPPQFNPLLGAPNLAQYWVSNADPEQAVMTDFIWGQGAKLGIKKLIVYQDRCPACSRH